MNKINSTQQEQQTVKTEASHIKVSYTHQLSTLYFMLLIGVGVIVGLLIFFPQLGAFFLSVVLGSGAGSIVSQCIVIGLMIGVYIAVHIVRMMKNEYDALETITTYVAAMPGISTERLCHEIQNYKEQRVRMSLCAQRILSTQQTESQPEDLYTVHPRVVRIRTLVSVLEFLASSMPLIGLVGTLVGLSVAVSGMNGIVDTLGNTAGLTRNIDVALSGMGGAFFTTLFGIVAMITLRYIILCIDAAIDGLMSTIEKNWYDYIAVAVKKR